MVDVDTDRKDIKIVKVKADTIATELGNLKISNMVALGTLIGFTGIVTLEETLDAFHDMVPEDKKKIIPLNDEALKRGYEIGKKAGQEV
jgi:2-oxoglutarate ferredoxin oxidoreductase subunit gamma